MSVEQGPKAPNHSRTRWSKDTYILKFGLLGDSGVGKRTYADTVRDAWLTSFHRPLDSLGVEVSRHVARFPRLEARIMLWDLTGRFGFRDLQAAWVRGVAATIVMADASRPETVEHAARWLEAVRGVSPRAKLALFLNVRDSTTPGQLDASQRMMRSISRRYRAPLYVMSLKSQDAEALAEPLRRLARSVVRSARARARAARAGGDSSAATAPRHA